MAPSLNTLQIILLLLSKNDPSVMGSVYPSLSESESLDMFVLAYQIFPVDCFEFIFAGVKTKEPSTGILSISELS